MSASVGYLTLTVDDLAAVAAWLVLKFHQAGTDHNIGAGHRIVGFSVLSL